MAIYSGKDNAEKGYAPNLFRTGPDGRFSVVKPPGTYYIRVVERPAVSRPKFADYHMPAWNEATEVVASDPAAPPPPVNITLELGVRVTGRALRQDGKPFESAGVGGRQAGSGGEIDGQGRFTILGLPAGADQEIRISPNPEDYQYIRLVHVAGEKLKAGGTFDLGEVKFAPLPENPNFVGTLFNADGTPFTGLTAVILRDEAGTLMFGPNVREGRFKGRILPGEYRINTMQLPGEGLPLGTVSIKAGQVAEMDLKIPNREKGGGGKAPVAATSPSTGPTGGK